MKFKEYITEVFDSDVKLNYIMNTYYTYKVRFYINDFEYNFTADNVMDDTDKVEAWEVSFSLENDDYSGFDIAGTGNEFKVFSAVVKATKDFIKKKQPEFFFFTAKESSRQKLYEKFAKIIERKSNYKYIKNIKNIEDETFRDVLNFGKTKSEAVYIFERK